LPKQVQVVTNPITLSVNETVLGISSQDILSELRRENVKSSAGGLGSGEDMLARFAGQVIEQRHFFPVFPPQAREALPALSSGVEGLGGEGGVLPIGAGLDVGFSKLGEWLSVRPDVLILPSALPAFAKVVDSVLVINPGTLSKRRGAGTYASLSLHPRSAASDEEREANHVLGHEVHSRARVDVVRI
ncbi:DNA-directed DNA polymerase alpha subunit pol12, partial [Oleoguttula sp. CCFEE 5521]